MSQKTARILFATILLVISGWIYAVIQLNIPTWLNIIVSVILGHLLHECWYEC